MALEDLTGTNKYIANLVATNPLAADDRREGDDHIRGIKNVLLNTFGALAAPVNFGAYVLKAGDTVTGALNVNGTLTAGSGTAVISNDGTSTIIQMLGATVGQWGWWFDRGAGNLRWVRATAAPITTLAANGDLFAGRDVFAGADGSAPIALVGSVSTERSVRFAADGWRLRYIPTGQPGAGTFHLTTSANANNLSCDSAGNTVVRGTFLAGGEVKSGGGPKMYFDGGQTAHLSMQGTGINWSWGWNNTTGLLTWFGAGGGAQPLIQFDGVGNASKSSGAGSWVALSDARLKDRIEDYTAGLQEVLGLRPRWFSYRPGMGRDVDTRYVGMIAQEIEQVMPDTVTAGPGKVGELYVDDLRTFDPTNITYALVNAVKTLAARVEALEILLVGAGDA